MAWIHRMQRFPLGTRVRKYFNGYKVPFEGSVDQHSDRTDFYHITYDDGDSEEMTEDDVETHLLSLPQPQAQKPPKTLNLTNVPQATTSQDDEKANPDSSKTMSTVVIERPSPSSSKRKKRPIVLNLNENAPGLMCSNAISQEEMGKTSTVFNPKTTLKEVEKVEEDEEEEEEMETNIENEDEDEESVSEGTPEEINQLIGLPVERKVTKEGCGIDVVQGAVASYFPATKMFRVMYFNGECCDLTYQQVFDSIPADLRPVKISERRKRKVEDLSQTSEKTKPPLPSLSLKRPKSLDLNATSFATKRTKQSPKTGSLSSGSRSPSTPVVRESDMVAIDDVEIDIVRKVLFILVSTVDNPVVDAQLEALSSVDLKDKEALEMFVRKDGLTSLSELLSKWKDQVETEQGVLLILKTLAVLPGVTKDVILESKIGKRVRGIEKTASFKDPAISGLASWVIQKLKADVGVKDGKHSPGSSVKDKAPNDRENRSEKSGSPRQASTKPTISPRPHDVRLSKEKIATNANSTAKRSNSASHLQNLMKSRNGRETCTTRHDRDIFGNIVAPQKKSRLGTSNNWRARRSTVVLDQVCKRLTENAQEVEIVKVTKFEDNDWKPSKISFANDDSVCAFDKEVAVSKLLVYRPSWSTKPPNRPPVKPHAGPLRSILRVKLAPQEITSQSCVQPSDLQPPTVHSAKRPAVDPIVIPAEPTSRSEDVLEDGATESPMFDTSKLCKVVSPTEKRKQAFSPPPCIPVSEQPPLTFSDGAEVYSGLAGDDSNESLDSSLHKREEPAPAEAAAKIVAMSPVVSEDSDCSNQGDDESAKDITVSS